MDIKQNKSQILPKTLIVRSAHMLQFSHVFEEVAKEHSEIYVLSHAAYEKEIISQTSLPKSHILIYPHSKPFNLKYLKRYFYFSREPRLKFHTCVILYNNSSGSGYFHVKGIPFLTGAEKIKTYCVKGTKKEYSRRAFILNCLKEGITEILDQLGGIFFLCIWSIILYPVFRVFFFCFPQKKKNNNPKQIYFFTSQDAAYPSARVRCIDFARQLKQYGFSSKIFSLSGNSISVYNDMPFYPKRTEQPQAEDLPDITKAWVSIRLFFKIMFSSPACFYVQKTKYNCLAPFMIHILRGDPLILDMDDWEFPTLAFRYINCDFFFLRMAPRSIFLVAASHKLFERMKTFNENIYLISTGPDTKKFFPQKRTDEFFECVFGWAGIIFGHPILENILMAINALARIPRDIPVLIKIAGKGPLWAFLKDYVTNTLKEKRVRFCGWIEPGLMGDFLASIDVGLMPLARETLFLQSKSPTKLFEYMAVGLPTISSPVGEINHIIEHEKNGFLASDTEEFIHYMKLLAKNPRLRETMGKEALRTIKEKYSLECAGKTLNLALSKIR